MMSDFYRIKDERTMYCRAAMKANHGVWNPVTREWMFQDAGNHANAMAELYRATRPTPGMRDALVAMIADGTAAAAWGFDPVAEPISVDDLDRTEASRLLAAGYAVRRVLAVRAAEHGSSSEDDGAISETEDRPASADPLHPQSGDRQ